MSTNCESSHGVQGIRINFGRNESKDEIRDAGASKSAEKVHGKDK